MYNTTLPATSLPPLPAYTLRPLPPLVPGIPDAYLSIILLIVVYWAWSMLFHVIDIYDLFPQYRLHTPAEVLKRNHVSRWEVVKDVLIQQAIQAAFGVMLAVIEPESTTGKANYDIAVWAQRLRIAQRGIPRVLAVTGVDADALAQKAAVYSPSVAGALAGGLYPVAVDAIDGMASPTFARWELAVAKVIYWIAVPALQFALAIMIVDTWQYFLHRAMHMNKWLYTNFHSRHHRLYVPYAYGALYNHPLEAFVLDTCGAGLAYLVAGMTTRQGICFFVGSTLKTVDDHCGYAFPWDPLQHLTSNNAGYHDVHHQSWGVKTNFSQPFFTFWDRWLGTAWTGGDVSVRYERARLAAERKVQQDGNLVQSSHYTKSITDSNPIDSILATSNAPYISTSSRIANSALPLVPPGKATSQAAESRAQVLADKSPYGGVAVLVEETEEEQQEVQKVPDVPSAQSQALRFLRRSPRKRMQAGDGTSLVSGLSERVAGGARTRHGGGGKVLGYESSM